LASGHEALFDCRQDADLPFLCRHVEKVVAHRIIVIMCVHILWSKTPDAKRLIRRLHQLSLLTHQTLLLVGDQHLEEASRGDAVIQMLFKDRLPGRISLLSQQIHKLI